MLTRWLVRTVASLIGIGALMGTGYLLHRFGLKDPVRERFKEGIAASSAIRSELGLECNLKVDPSPDVDDQVIVTVQYPNPPVDASTRKDLVRNTNIVVRRLVHHIQHLKIVFSDEPENLPSWDGGVAIAGAPVPIGAHIAAAEPVDAGTPRVAKPKVSAVGTVTLVTFPDSDVFKGKDKLGRTPLFNVDLPVGTHMLTLVGDDGVRHRLSMPVKLGKNKPLKMNLADLPAK